MGTPGGSLSPWSAGHANVPNASATSLHRSHRVANRANELAAEANALKRAEYQRRYQLGEQKLGQKLNANENAEMQKAIASLRDELAAAPKPEQLNSLQNELACLKKERDSLLQENHGLIVTIQDLQPQADALARIKSDVQTDLGGSPLFSRCRRCGRG